MTYRERLEKAKEILEESLSDPASFDDDDFGAVVAELKEVLGGHEN
jgi:hypothetical protein